MDSVLKEYISDEQMAEIAVAEWTMIVRTKLEKDAERIIANVAQEILWPAIDAALDGNACELIKAKTLKNIESLSEFSIFRKANYWEKEESVGQMELNKAIRECSPQLKVRVAEVMSAYDAADIRAALEDAAMDVIRDAFSNKEQSNDQ